jgi:iron(III) transport system permease protein
LLVALYALSDFGAVAAMRFDAFTWVIFGAYRAGFNPSRAAVLASVLIVVALVLVILESASRGAQVRTVSARSVGHTHNVKINQPVMQMILGTTVAIALAFPVWRVTTWVWGNFDRDSITPMLESVWASVRYSLFAALITVLLALPVAVLASRYKSRGAKILEGATFVTHALPGIVIGISMVFVGVKALRPIYLEAPLLILAYVVLFLPLAVASLRAALDQIPTSLDDVARSLGASPISVLRRVSLPIVLPSLGAAVALITLAAMKELPVTMLLHPTGVDTIATRLWTHTSVSDYASAGPYALAMLLFVAVPTAIASRSGR